MLASNTSGTHLCTVVGGQPCTAPPEPTTQLLHALHTLVAAEPVPAVPAPPTPPAAAEGGSRSVDTTAACSNLEQQPWSVGAQVPQNLPGARQETVGEMARQAGGSVQEVVNHQEEESRGVKLQAGKKKEEESMWTSIEQVPGVQVVWEESGTAGEKEGGLVLFPSPSRQELLEVRLKAGLPLYEVFSRAQMGGDAERQQQQQ